MSDSPLTSAQVLNLIFESTRFRRSRIGPHYENAAGLSDVLRNSGQLSQEADDCYSPFRHVELEWNNWNGYYFLAGGLHVTCSKRVAIAIS